MGNYGKCEALLLRSDNNFLLELIFTRFRFVVNRENVKANLCGTEKVMSGYYAHGKISGSVKMI